MSELTEEIKQVFSNESIFEPKDYPDNKADEEVHKRYWEARAKDGEYRRKESLKIIAKLGKKFIKKGYPIVVFEYSGACDSCEEFELGLLTEVEYEKYRSAHHGYPQGDFTDKRWVEVDSKVEMKMCKQWDAKISNYVEKERPFYELKNGLEDWMFRFLPSGFEINEGSQGWAVIDFRKPSNQVTIFHEWNVQTVEEETYVHSLEDESL